MKNDIDYSMAPEDMETADAAGASLGTAEEEKGLSIEETFRKLDDMIEKLESADTPLEEVFSVYRESMELLKDCSQRIDLVEKKVMVLSEEGGLDEF